MAFWPDSVFLLLPAVGLLATCTSSCFLVAMWKTSSEGFFAAVYTLRAIDLLMGLSLFYAGFHGIFLSVYGEQNEGMPPVHCLFTALHLHVWVFTDSCQLLLLLLLCIDQFISVLWTKQHNEVSSYYFNSCSLLLLLLLSSVSLVPAWIEPFLLAENSTVRVSSFCAMQDVLLVFHATCDPIIINQFFPKAFGQNFYDVQLEVRKWSPLAGIAALLLTGSVLCLLQLNQGGRFKWSDNNRQSARFFLLIFCRALLLVASVHVPLMGFQYRLVAIASEDTHFLQEIAIRTSEVLLFGLLEFALDILLLPQFPAKMGEFFNLHEVKRTWQSADDPPNPTKSVGTSGWDIFGSFHTTAGNIVGEAGVPMELNADLQRSISFYYKDGD